MNQHKISIRRALRSDAVTIHTGLLMIARHLSAEHKVTATPAAIREHGFGAEAAFTVLIAEADGQFAGMCVFFKSFSTWRGEPGAYVQDLVVDEHYRQHGVGAKLLRATAAHVRTSGGNYLRLSVDAANAKAQSFYKKHGLVWCQEERIFAARGEAFIALAEVS